jgi:glycosyltransferase involved in cell wall biosynthesis
MKFSVVTCTWNSEPYLAQSIASVLVQDYPDIEYIFVDGGSTDGTLERIRSIPRPLRLIENVRGGISRAMNQGIAAASGEVIAHLHSDDYYLHPHVLSRVAEALTRTARGWAIGGIVVDSCAERCGRRSAYSMKRFDTRWI